MNSKSSLLASPRAAGAAIVTRTSSAFTPELQVKKKIAEEVRCFIAKLIK